MRKVRQRPFEEYFTASNDSVLRLDRMLPKFILHNQKINPLSIYSAIVVFCLLGGMASRLSLAIGISMLFFLLFVYLQTKSLANNLYIKRKLNKNQYQEFETIEARYSILNASAMRTPQLELKDHFEPGAEQTVRLQVPSLLDAGSKKKFVYKRTADSGMGMKCIGPISLCFTDVFGFFEFEVIEDDVLEIEVLPKVEPLPEIPMIGSKDSGLYGQYIVNQQGTSINFNGVREYQPGDPLRHISWKLSARYGDLFVKEFENLANAELSIYMNLDPQHHMGTRKESTWEIIKDIALAIASQQVRLSNSISFYSQDFMLEPFRGESGLHDLATYLIKIDPMLKLSEAEEFTTFSTSSSSKDLIRKFIPFQKNGGNAIFITPYLTADTQSLIDAMKSLVVRDITTWCVLLDTESFYKKYFRKLESHLTLNAPDMKGYDAVVRRLKLEGVEVIEIRAEQDLQGSFLNNRRIS